MRGRNTTKENEEVVIEIRREAQRLYEKQFMYYTISRAFIGIPSIILSYSFPHILYSKKKRRTANNMPHNSPILAPPMQLHFPPSPDGRSPC